MSDQIQSEAVVTEAATPIESRSVVCNPRNEKCRYWAKVIRAGQPIPLPEEVTGANDVPGPYIRKGDDVEIFEGDFLLEGEENHHTKKRGWTYDLRYLTISTEGKLRVLGSSWTNSDVKQSCRLAGRKDLLGGSGDVAAMIREIHARRDGLVSHPTLAQRRAKWEAEQAAALAAEPATESVV